jgi:hypothetical protein
MWKKLTLKRESTILRKEFVPNSLTLVDMSPTPEFVYIALESLYNDAMHHPLEVQATIEYFEGRLMDYNLPLDRDTYEEEIRSPESEQYKRLILARDNVYESPRLLVANRNQD